MNDDREKFEIALPKEVKNDSGYISVFYTDDEYEIAFEGWQAAKESDRKELEELRTRLSGKTCFVPPEFTAELEEARQRITAAEKEAHRWGALWDALNEDTGKQIQALEKKLAEQQAIACKLQNYLKAPNEGNSSLILIAQTLLSIMESSSGELTKREAAARQHGFDEGKQLAAEICDKQGRTMIGNAIRKLAYRHK